VSQPAADPVVEPTTEPVADPSTVGEAEPEGDLTERLAAQEKVNRDLERKLKRSEDNRARVAELEAKLAELSKPAEGEPIDADAIRAEARREAEAAAQDRLKVAELKAAAKGTVGDDMLPHLHKFVDLSQVTVDADGNVDADDLADAIAEAIKTTPSLAAAQGGQRFKGTADGGTRKETRPAQLTQADMARMSPEQIVDATDKGQFDVLLGRS
jgi:hypothetical protein